MGGGDYFFVRLVGKNSGTEGRSLGIKFKEGEKSYRISSILGF